MKLVLVLETFVKSFRNRTKEFSSVIEIERSQLQDATMTLGQKFEAYVCDFGGRTPDVFNQIAFKVIGNDLVASMAA